MNAAFGFRADFFLAVFFALFALFALFLAICSPSIGLAHDQGLWFRLRKPCLVTIRSLRACVIDRVSIGASSDGRSGSGTSSIRSAMPPSWMSARRGWGVKGVARPRSFADANADGAEGSEVGGHPVAGRYVERHQAGAGGDDLARAHGDPEL